MDIDLSHPWTLRHRIPVLSNVYYLHQYLLVLLASNDAKSVFSNTVVTEDEAFTLGSYITYLLTQYNLVGNTFPVDISPLFDTLIISKSANGGWYYRQASWENTAKYPSPSSVIDLLCLLDSIEIDENTGDIRESWSQWKKQYSLCV